MEEDLECPVCLDIFGINQNHIKAPKVLKCGDTICKECLITKLNNSNDKFFLCPLFKQKINKEENIDEYTTNKNVIKIINSCFNISDKEIENKEGDKPIQYNIISLGNTSVGKTSIFQRLSKDIFSQNTIPTLGCDNYIYNIKYKNKKYKLTLKDSSGQEKYKSLTKSFLRNIDGVLFIYDISDPNSFNDLKSWFELYKEENEKVIGLLIGSKCDCERQVNKEEAKKFAEENELKYLEVSAKLDKNLRKAIVCLLKIIIESKQNIETKEIKATKIKLERSASYFSLSSADIDSVPLCKNKNSKKKKCECG